MTGEAVSVLILSPYPEQIAPTIERSGDKWSASVADAIPSGFDWVVSYGYRSIIRAPVLTDYADRIINLHISMLPWNRGMHPNVWAWLEGTPHGVTIHHIDAGLDTGDIIAQRRVDMDRHNETLASSYARLQREVIQLFAGVWPKLRIGQSARYPQPAGGSRHFAKEINSIIMPDSWDTTVNTLIAANKLRAQKSQ